MKELQKIRDFLDRQADWYFEMSKKIANEDRPCDYIPTDKEIQEQMHYTGYYLLYSVIVKSDFENMIESSSQNFYGYEFQLNAGKFNKLLDEKIETLKGKTAKISKEQLYFYKEMVKPLIKLC